MIDNKIVFEAGEQAGHIVPVNGWKWGGNALQEVISKVKGAGLIHDPVNGFKAAAGHLGTHTKDYVKKLVAVMGDKTTQSEILEGLAEMRDLIMGGTFVR